MSKLIITLITIFAFSLCHANSGIKLAAPYITSLIEEDGSGYYQRIFKQVLNDLPFQVNEQFYPYKRALRLFERKDVDCIYSFTSVFQEKLGKDNIIYSYPLGAFAYFIFSPKDKAAISSSREIIGTRVGAVLGHDSYYNDFLEEGVKLSMVDEDRRNLILLKLKRIDYMIGALPDLTPYLDQLNYNPKAPLVKNFDRITCHTGDISKDFLKEISKKLRAMNEQGKYKELGGSLYFEFEDTELY